MEKTKKSLAESPNVNLYFCGFRKTWIKYVQKAIQGIHVVSCKQGCVDKFIVSISARTSSYSTHKSWQYAHPNQLFLDQLAHPNLQCHLQWWTGCRVSSDQSWSWSCWTISLICLEQIACCWASLFLAFRAIPTEAPLLGLFHVVLFSKCGMDPPSGTTSAWFLCFFVGCSNCSKLAKGSLWHFFCFCFCSWVIRLGPPHI